MFPLKLAKHYFKLSNESDFDGISQMFTESTTYYSGKKELYLGVDDIMSMQRAHHNSYKKLQWNVISVKEVKPGIVHFEFNFEGQTQEGDFVEFSGQEDVVVFNEKIQHIHVQLN